MARVTRVGPGPRSTNARVECLPWPDDLGRWSERRRHHYEVIVDSDPDGANRRALARSQPQAIVARIGTMLLNGTVLEAGTDPAAVFPSLGLSPTARLR